MGSVPQGDGDVSHATLVSAQDLVHVTLDLGPLQSFVSSTQVQLRELKASNAWLTTTLQRVVRQQECLDIDKHVKMNEINSAAIADSKKTIEMLFTRNKELEESLFDLKTWHSGAVQQLKEIETDIDKQAQETQAFWKELEAMKADLGLAAGKRRKVAFQDDISRIEVAANTADGALALAVARIDELERNAAEAKMACDASMSTVSAAVTQVKVDLSALEDKHKGRWASHMEDYVSTKDKLRRAWNRVEDLTVIGALNIGETKAAVIELRTDLKEGLAWGRELLATQQRFADEYAALAQRQQREAGVLLEARACVFCGRGQSGLAAPLTAFPSDGRPKCLSCQSTLTVKDAAPIVPLSGSAAADNGGPDAERREGNAKKMRMAVHAARTVASKTYRPKPGLGGTAWGPDQAGGEAQAQGMEPTTTPIHLGGRAAASHADDGISMGGSLAGEPSAGAGASTSMSAVGAPVTRNGSAIPSIRVTATPRSNLNSSRNAQSNQTGVDTRGGVVAGVSADAAPLSVSQLDAGHGHAVGGAAMIDLLMRTADRPEPVRDRRRPQVVTTGRPSSAGGMRGGGDARPLRPSSARA